jgi:PAS domain S-box-containing protein
METEGRRWFSDAASSAVSVLESMGTAFLALDANDTIIYLNTVGENLVGRTRAEVVGRNMWDLFPAGRNADFGPAYDRARDTRQAVMFEAWAPTLHRWLEVRAVPERENLAVFLIDVTDRHRAQEAADRGASRLQLLLDVSSELSSAPDAETGLRHLAGLVVPALGDWAVVTLIDDGAGPTELRDVGSAHRDPELAPLVSRYAQLRVSSLMAEAPLFRSGRTEKSELIPADATQVVTDVLNPGEARDLIRQLGPESLSILPLLANGRTVGLLSLFGSQALDEAQLRLAGEVTSRAALAVDNARAYARARASQADAERSAGRLRLLGDVSELLSRSLDWSVAVQQLARVVVPELADWCTVTLADNAGLATTLAWAHRDAAKEAVLARYVDLKADSPSDESPVAACLRTGEPVLVPAGSALMEQISDDAGAALLAELAPHSVAVLPLNARGRTLGAMAMVTGENRGPLTQEELHTAQEVARRAGLALENARLYAEQRQLAETLQRSLLTSPPATGAVEIIARYVPAASEAQVGGDWYDAFVVPGGDVMLVIGDVMGHDGMAAAKMGQLRGILRTLAYSDPAASPSEILVRAENTAVGLGLETLATAILARLSPPAGPGSPTSLAWSNAGHLPPVLLLADGTAQVLEVAGDLLLGIDANVSRLDQQQFIPAGSTLLLFTDGLVERRDADMDAGLARLQDVVRDLGTAPLEVLCDTVLTRLDARSGEDDVALLAVRGLPSPVAQPRTPTILERPFRPVGS